MQEVSVMFTLPSDTFEALQSTAQREGSSPGAILRAALRKDLNALAADCGIAAPFADIN